jgi:hypothetical protein
MGVRAFLFLSSWFFGIGAAIACPLCPQTINPSLAEQLSQADAAVLVQWELAIPANKETHGSTTFSIVNIVRQPGADYERGATLTLDRDCAGRQGDLFLLMGTKVGGIEWNRPLAVTETSFKYIIESPGSEVPAAKRLPFYIKYLEHSDPLISDDAFSEFASAPYRDVVLVADQFSAARLKEWIAKKETNQTRIGFYGMMLGLVGSKDDATFLKSEINRDTETYRLGLDGLMAGYALLLGEQGLPLLDEKLTGQSSDRAAAYAAMQTLRFLWEYENGRVEKDRLRKSMRLLIERQEFTDLAIKDLTRWEDWELLPTLVELYDRPDQSDSKLKRSVILFLIALSKKRAPAGDEVLAGRVAVATAQLAILKDRDPKLVKDAERYVF